MSAMTPASKALFRGPGEMRGLARELDWARTPFGPVEGWPQSLRSTVRTLLSSQYPMILTWGPSFTQVYNDAYAKLIGAGHPEALGGDIRVTLAAGFGREAAGERGEWREASGEGAEHLLSVDLIDKRGSHRIE